jgi:hypothetical protein
MVCSSVVDGETRVRIGHAGSAAIPTVVGKAGSVKAVSVA